MDGYIYYALYASSVFSLAKGLQLILEISATYSLADNYSVSCARNAWFRITISIQVPCDGVFFFIFFKTMYNKTIIRFGFCNILNDESLVKYYQPRPSAWLITLTSTLIIPDIKKTSSNNYSIFMGNSYYMGSLIFKISLVVFNRNDTVQHSLGMVVLFTL